MRDLILYLLSWHIYLFLLVFMMLALFGFYIIIWVIGIHSFRAILISFGASKRRVLDISELKPTPPEDLQPNIAALENLGFRRLGEIQIKLPTFSSPIQSWIFISSDSLTRAELAESFSKGVEFSTIYSDKASLETTFPMGERINTPDFRSHTIATNIEKAHQHHIQQIIDFGKTHPHPRIIKSMEDYIEWDGIYRKLYIRRKFLRHDLTNIIGFTTLVYSILITLVILINHTHWDTLMTDISSLLRSLSLAITPAALIAFVSAYSAILMGKRETKST